MSNLTELHDTLWRALFELEAGSLTRLQAEDRIIADVRTLLKAEHQAGYEDGRTVAAKVLRSLRPHCSWCGKTTDGEAIHSSCRQARRQSKYLANK